MLTLDNISKRYVRANGPVVALDGISLTVEDGEFVAVRGPSGCGKTTLLLVCGALLSPDGGTIRLGDETPYALSPEARARFRARRLGFVFQQFHLVPYLSVRDNILAASLAAGTPGAGERADALMERLGLTGRSDHVPSELSVGERQRTALARALLNRPALVLADEPTGNLDEANGAAVLEALAEYARLGGTVLMVTHDARASRVAHRIVEMAQGKLVSAAGGASQP